MNAKSIAYEYWYDEMRDDSAELLEKYVKKGKRLCHAKVGDYFYYDIVQMMLRSFRVLEKDHIELYNRVVEKGKEAYLADPEDFKFFLEDQIKFLLYYKNGAFEVSVEDYCYMDLNYARQPLALLDICYTLSRFGDESPFSCVSVEPGAIENARKALLSIDPYELRYYWNPPSDVRYLSPIPELERYCDRHQNEHTVCPKCLRRIELATVCTRRRSI